MRETRDSIAPKSLIRSKPTVRVLNINTVVRRSKLRAQMSSLRGDARDDRCGAVLSAMNDSSSEAMIFSAFAQVLCKTLSENRLARLRSDRQITSDASYALPS